MLLGKRPRPAMKRTTSMKDVAVDLSSATAASKPSDPEIQAIGDGNQLPWGDGSYNIDRRPNLTAASALGVMVPPPGPRRNSVSYASAVEAAPFLRACALCNKHLHSGRDIFMYRGEIGFCSSECREQQMKLDEWKEKAKCSTSSAKDSSQAKAKRSPTASGGGSGNGETVAAA